MSRLKAARRRLLDRVKDARLDARTAKAFTALRASAAYQALPAYRILILGIQSPKRGNSLVGIYDRMTSAKHELVKVSCGVGTLSKPENSNKLLEEAGYADFDYVITTDDDITVPDHFIDDFVAIAALADFDIAQPAHRLISFWNHHITRREAGWARATNFVEVGPLAMFRANTFSRVFPFPVTRFGWGVDLLWSELASRHGWKLGVVDATPIEHLSPAGQLYNWDAAEAELAQFLKDQDVKIDFGSVRVISHEALGMRL